MRHFSLFLAAGLTLAPLVGRAQMTDTQAAQITTWLNDGPLDFTDIFTSNTANPMSSSQFHTAADGMGPTITLATVVTYSGQTLVIGGFDPLSWDSTGGNTLNGNNVEEAGLPPAFLFNLSTDTIEYENSDPSGTQFQTFDSSDIGPAWGAGFDLAFGAYLGYGSELLTKGAAFSYSYGGSFGDDILGNPATFNNLNGGIYDTFTVSELDVYTFAPPGVTSPPSSAVPDEGKTALLLALAGGAMGLFRTKRFNHRIYPRASGLLPSR